MFDWLIDLACETEQRIASSFSRRISPVIVNTAESGTNIVFHCDPANGGGSNLSVSQQNLNFLLVVRTQSRYGGMFLQLFLTKDCSAQ